MNSIDAKEYFISSAMATNDEACALKPPPLELAINRHVPKSSSPTPLGTLSILPPELRIEIYRHMHSYRYYLGPCLGAPFRKWRSIAGVELPTVSLSKVISQEFLAVFYAEAVFRIHDWGSCGERIQRLGDGTRAHNDIPFVQQIQNFEVYAALQAQSDGYYTLNRVDPYEINKQLSEKRADPLSVFTGDGIPRKTCAIVLSFQTPKAILFLQSPFFGAIKRLTNFETVMLEVSSKTGFGYYWSREDALTYTGDTDRAVAVTVIVDAMKGALEPSLGPSVISKPSDMTKTDLVWNITFHPRDYVVKRDREAGTIAQEGKLDEVSPQVGSS